MPLCYGGGVKTPEQVEHIISLGVEKVSISSAALERPELISEAAQRVGSQSVVVVVDVIKSRLNGGYEIWTRNASRPTGICPSKFSQEIGGLGAGEIVINSIDNDGMMKGYDFDLVRSIWGLTTLPITVLGGAGSLGDIAKLINTFSILGVAAGSLFVFKGIYRAVLINYPSRSEKDMLIKEHF